MSDEPTTRRVGIRDVAAAAGVSPTTVSHALSGARTINVATRERVLREAARLGYVADPRARGLRGGRTFMIGMITDEIASSPHAGQIVSGAQDAATARDSVVVVLESDGIAEREQAQIRVLQRHRVDGFVYARVFHQAVNVPQLLHGTHVVLADASATDPRYSSVVPDELAIGIDATTHLLEYGHRRIGFTTIRDPLPAAVGRERGYRAALERAGIAIDETLISRTSADTEGGRRAAEELLDRADRPTAVFCFNDEVAMGVYQVAAALDLRVPRDLSVVGVDDLQLIAASLLPPLTTVALPHYEMGRWAVERLHDLVYGSGSEPAQTALRGRLVTRGSVAPPA